MKRRAFLKWTGLMMSGVSVPVLAGHRVGEGWWSADAYYGNAVVHEWGSELMDKIYGVLCKNADETLPKGTPYCLYSSEAGESGIMEDPLWEFQTTAWKSGPNIDGPYFSKGLNAHRWGLNVEPARDLM